MIKEFYSFFIILLSLSLLSNSHAERIAIKYSDNLIDSNRAVLKTIIEATNEYIGNEFECLPQSAELEQHYNINPDEGILIFNKLVTESLMHRSSAQGDNVDIFDTFISSKGDTYEFTLLLSTKTYKIFSRIEYGYDGKLAVKVSHFTCTVLER